MGSGHAGGRAVLCAAITENTFGARPRLRLRRAATCTLRVLAGQPARLVQGRAANQHPQRPGTQLSLPRRTAPSSSPPPRKHTRSPLPPSPFHSPLQVQLYKYNSEEYETLIKPESGAAGWGREETDYLFDLCEHFDLRWMVIADRYAVRQGQAGRQGGLGREG